MRVKQRVKTLLMKSKTGGAFYRTLLTLRYHGVKRTFAEMWKKLTGQSLFGFELYVYRPPSRFKLRKQSKQQFPRAIKFSILTALYNTDTDALTQMIASVQAQSYANWELCLADGSDNDGGLIQQTCMEYANRDKRIKYLKLGKNLGIAGNTNMCATMAAGDYISFLDHDDMLTPDALYETAAAICKHGAQFVYSDEDKVNADTSEYYDPIYKPDYAPDHLRATNYICHFVSVSKEIADIAGPFDSELDGAQDYDFVLRAIEKTKVIHHIPKVLYHWRTHQASTAVDISLKGYAVEAGRKALISHIGRQNIPGNVINLSFPGTYRVKYDLLNTPLVTIIICGNSSEESSERCLSSIQAKTTYSNYEIIVVNRRDLSYSESRNSGAGQANGEYIMFLNSDIEIISEDCVEEMLRYAQRGDVGAVGVKIIDKNTMIRHAGLVVGLQDTVSHCFCKQHKKDECGYLYRLQTVQNYSAVSASCMMVRKTLHTAVGGFSQDLSGIFADADLCLKIREKGLLVVWTPFCEILQHTPLEPEAASCSQPDLVEHERVLFENKWKHYRTNGDPYYSINFCRDNADFLIT